MTNHSCLSIDGPCLKLMMQNELCVCGEQGKKSHQPKFTPVGDRADAARQDEDKLFNLLKNVDTS